MAKFTVDIELGNEAMNSPDDVAAALKDVCRRLNLSRSNDTKSYRIMDSNGNTVGWAKYESPEFDKS